jgi:hypothetical protein
MDWMAAATAIGNGDAPPRCAARLDFPVIGTIFGAS